MKNLKEKTIIVVPDPVGNPKKIISVLIGSEGSNKHLSNEEMQEILKIIKTNDEKNIKDEITTQDLDEINSIITKPIMPVGFDAKDKTKFKQQNNIKQQNKKVQSKIKQQNKNVGGRHF